MAEVDTLVKVALGEVGYVEKASHKSEESKTANPGSANHTKYGCWIGADGDYWCASFVSWCFDKAFGSIRGKTLLHTYSPACNTLMAGFKQAGAFGSTPKVGDVVFFSGSRHNGANHVGIVVGLSDSEIKTVEGNTSGGVGVVDNGGMVARKSYSRNSVRILGYGRPKYKEGFDMAELPLVKYGSKGAEVKAMQAILKGKYDRSLSVDGDFGTNTARQLKAVQKQHGLAQDAKCGSKTWKALLTK